MSTLHMAKCEMCLKYFIFEIPQNHRKPHWCPDCTERRKAELSRLRMARMRADRKART